MKNAVKKSVSMLLCLAMLATSFVVPGFVSSAYGETIPEYAELESEYEDFVYIGTEVYETDYEGNNLVPTDYYVLPGDWLEIRTYIKSDHYIGDTSIVSLFSNDFFDVRDPNGMMSGSNEYYNGELYTVNDMHHVVESRGIEAQIVARPVSEFTVLTKTSNIENPEIYDAVMVGTSYGASENNLAGDYISDYWVYSYKVQVKDGLMDGSTGSITSPLELWQSAVNESTGQYDRRKRSYVYLSPEKIGYEADEVLFSQCDMMADIMNGVCELNVIIDDMNHEFTIGSGCRTLNLDANGGWFDWDSGEYYTVEYMVGEEISYIPHPIKEGFIFVGWENESGEMIYDIPAVMPDYDITLRAVWEPCVYELCFDANGGYFADLDTEYICYAYESGMQIEFPEDPEKVGYIFTGWSTSSYEYEWIPEVMPYENVTLYALWEPFEETPYTVNYYYMNTDGTYNDVPDKTECFAGRTGDTVTHIYEDVYGFSVDTEMGIPEGVIEADGSLLLDVYLNRNRYNAYFRSNGGEFFDGTETVIYDVYYGAEIPESELPAREGYIFIGWDMYPDGMTMPAENIVFTAVWEPCVYNAVYNANGGCFEDGTEARLFEQRYGEFLISPDECPTREGYVFAGWTSEEGSDIIADIENMTMPMYGIEFYAVFVPCDDTPYTVEIFMMNTEGEYELTETIVFAGTSDSEAVFVPDEICGFVFNEYQSITNGPIFADGSLMLEVYYDREEYMVEFDTGMEIIAFSCYYGSEITEPEIPSKQGYNFDGWIDNEGNHAYFPYTMPDRDIRFTARWYVCDYTVRYNADGGCFSDGYEEKSEVYRFGDVIRNTEYPEREGYVFVGWMDEETGNEISVPMHMPACDINLRALWEAESYTLYFDDGNGNTIGIYEMYYGDNVYFPSEHPEKEGFTFAGWMSEYGEFYYDEGFPMPACDLRLIACWERNEYIARWIVDGELIHEEAVGFDCVVSHPNVPYKEGYTFEGWAGPDGRIYSDGSDYLMPAEDIIFTAVYIPETDIPYRVEIYEMYSDGCYPEYPSYIQSFVGETDCIAVIHPENYVKNGFTVDTENSIFEGIICADGSLVLKVYLARNEYEMIIDTGDSLESQIYYYGSMVAEPVQPCREGFYFDGWTDENGNYVRFPFIMPAESVTLHALWVQAEYTVTFDAGAGEFSDGYYNKEYVYFYGEEIYFPEEPVREGFTFIGWDSEIPGYMPACDMYFTAMWEANEYSILFLDGFGNIFCEETFRFGEDISHIFYDTPIPSMEGYIFIRWEEEYSGNDRFPQTMPSWNLTYVAQWERNLCQIEWINDGEIWERATLEYGAVIEPPADPLKEGYTFIGWFDENGYPMEFPCIAEQDMIFHAYWEANEYNIVFCADGGEFANGEYEIVSTLRYGENIEIPDYPCKEGYYFVGWSTESGTPYLVAIPETMPAYDLVLYAVWQIGEFTLSFDDGFGNNFLTISMDYGEDMAIVEYISCPNPENRKFMYWKDIDTDEAFVLPASMPARDVILVAQWDDSEYTVIFDYNGGYDYNGEYMRAITASGGDMIDIECPVREGCVFVGWEDGYGNFVDMPMIMPFEDIHLIAVWEYEIYTLTYEDEYGYVFMVQELHYGEEIPEIVSPTKEGYTFAGWYSDYGYDYPSLMPAHDMVLRAMWTVNHYKVRWVYDDEIFEYEYEFGQDIYIPEPPAKEGYIFTGWEPSVPVIMPAYDLEFFAMWEPAGPVIYRIETYTMNTAGTYDMSAVYHTTDRVGNVSANPVILEGFELNSDLSVLEGYAHPENELVLKIYIDRQSFTFTKIIDGKSFETEYLYGSIIAEPDTPIKDGYIFTDWDGEIPDKMPANDVTVTANFRKITPEDNIDHAISFYITPLNNVTLNYGESIKLQAYTKNLPEGYKIKWSVDSSCVTIKPSSSGKTCTVTAVSTGGAAITAWVVDENGQKVRDKDGAIIKDTEILYSEVNTWLIILNFFKRLFKIGF